MIESTADCTVTEFRGPDDHSGNDGQADQELLQQFVTAQDEHAFEILVRRHGPMVHGVCRRVLHDPHSADDAFQATFLLLARKCRSLRAPELLANWLYGVAYRTALKARENAAKRREYERRAAEMASYQPPDEAMTKELAAVLDEEINRLPMKYRAPLVLCYLEGATNAQAARRLGWPEGSISGRLAKARELLRSRLTRRGLNFSAGMLATILLQERASAAVSTALVKVTVDGVTVSLAGAGAKTILSPGVVELADEVLQSMELGRAKALVVACAALLFLIGFAVVPARVTLWAASFDASESHPASAQRSASVAGHSEGEAHPDLATPASGASAACGAGACGSGP